MRTAPPTPNPISMLAQVTNNNLPDPSLFSSIGWVCVILVCIVVGTNAVLDLWHKIQAKPTGADALKEANEIFAEKKRLEKLELDFAHYKEITEREAAIRRKGIYDKIDRSREEVLQRVDDTRKELEDKLKDVNARVDTIPDRVITTLRNTGAIQ